jgi:outer membrane protein assembly factor BamB
MVWSHESAKVGNSQSVVLAIEGRRAFVGLGNSVRAHDINTGAVAWHDTLSAATITDITAKHGLVVAVGSRFDATIDLLVRAYDSVRGTLLWEDRFDSGDGKEDYAFSVAIAGGRVLVAGETLTPGVGPTFLLRAYKRRTGELLWQDSSAQAFSGSAFAVIGHAGIVAIAGQKNLQIGADPFVRAYDAGQGVLLWEHQASRAEPSIGFFDALAVQGGRLFAAGTKGGLLVEAYDIQTGVLAWQREASSGIATALSTAFGAIYAAGFDEAGWVVEAYDASTGEIIWQDQSASGGLSGIARDDDAARGRLFVVGESRSNFMIRAYHAR